MEKMIEWTEETIGDYPGSVFYELEDIKKAHKAGDQAKIAEIRKKLVDEFEDSIEEMTDDAVDSGYAYNEDDDEEYEGYYGTFGYGGKLGLTAIEDYVDDVIAEAKAKADAEADEEEED